MAQDKTIDDSILQILPVGDLTGLVKAVQEALNHLGSKELWFRGHADASWHLWPVIFRPEYASAQECRLSQLFMRDAPIRYANCPGSNPDEAFDWLSLMRHYGLPTRLLDWTTSIQVAAFFAVSAPDDESDAAIWVLQGDSLSACQGSRGLCHPTTPSVEGLAMTALDGGVDSSSGLVLPVIPTAFDLRMLVQQSRFTIHGSTMPLENRPQTGRYLAKITIPKEARKILRLGLNLLGTRPSALFPDLDSLAKELAANERTPKKRS